MGRRMVQKSLRDEISAAVSGHPLTFSDHEKAAVIHFGLQALWQPFPSCGSPRTNNCFEFTYFYEMSLWRHINKEEGERGGVFFYFQPTSAHTRHAVMIINTCFMYTVVYIDQSSQIAFMTQRTDPYSNKSIFVVLLAVKVSFILLLWKLQT